MTTSALVTQSPRGLRIAPLAVGFALLSACSGASPTSRSGAGNPPPPAATAPASTPPPSTTQAAPEDRTFVEIRSGYASMCGRTERGSLYCWGITAVPGETAMATKHRPTRIEGMPPIAGFTVLNGGILIGWDAAGKVYRVAQDTGTTPFRVVEGFQEAQPAVTSLGSSAYSGARPATSPIVAGSRDCLLSRSGELFCTAAGGTGSYVGTPLLRIAAPPLRALAEAECGMAVDGSVVCWNLSQSPRELFGKQMGPYGVIPAPVEGPVEQVLVMGARARGNQLCIRRPDGSASCDDPVVDRRLRELAEGKRVTRLFRGSSYILCLTREDGVSRCTARFEKPWADLEVIHEVLPKVDGSLGVAVYPYNICALGRDHRVRCWGQRSDGRVGDGVPLELSRAERVPDVTGASEIGHEDGVLCARFGEARVACWGAIAQSVHVPRRDLKLPEPVDKIEGGAVLCVHGAKSGDWYCRNKAFFFGSLPDDFARLVDTRGAPVRDVTITVDNGLGIAAAKPSGGAGRFYYEGRAKPLKLQWLDAADPMASAVFYDLRGGAVLASGAAVFGDPAGFSDVPRRIEGKHRAVLRTARCAVDAQDRLLCIGPPAGTKVVLTDVAEADADCVRTKKGEVHCLANRPRKPTDVATFRRIEGLPPTIVEIARQCGRTVEGEIYCWGSVFDLGVLTPTQMTPVEVAMP